MLLLFIQCYVYMDAACAAQSKPCHAKSHLFLASDHHCCSLPPIMKNNIKHSRLSAELVVASCFQYHSAFIFTLFTITGKIYAGNIKNNDVLFSRSQMHNYIKSKSQNTTPSHGIRQAALCVLVCVCKGFGLKGCECVCG